MGSGKAAHCNILPSILLLCCSVLSSAQTTANFNITNMLDSFPNFSVLNQLLSSSGVANQINSRQSLTLLAPSNDVLNAFISSNANADAVKMADLLRYHVLLKFFSFDDLKALDPANYTSVTTLLQTTGRANSDEGFVNIYNLRDGILIGPTVPGSSFNATVINNIAKSGFDISIIHIGSVLVPVGFNTAAGDLIDVLESRDVYTQFISFLKSSGVDSIFAGRLTGAGITVFAPTDEAFGVRTAGAIQDLSVIDQKLLMQYHALTVYKNLDSLKTKVEFPLETIASTVTTTYKLNVTSDGKKVSLHTGINEATITETLYDARPVTMYSIDEVLLPPELFPSTGPPSPAPTSEPASLPKEHNTTTSTAPAYTGAPGPEKPGNAASVAKSRVVAFVLFVSSVFVIM